MLMPPKNVAVVMWMIKYSLRLVEWSIKGFIIKNCWYDFIAHDIVWDNAVLFFLGRHKPLVNSHRSSPWLAHLHSEYMALGLPSPWSPSRSCDINQQDAYGRSALHYATEQGHTYIVHMLIKAGEFLKLIMYFLCTFSSKSLWFTWPIFLLILSDVLHYQK